MIVHPLITPVVLVMNDEFWLPYCLEASRGWFDRYVIYDVGSTDATPEIIQWFANSMKGEAEFFVRQVPFVEPRIQGVFRNSMIAEARSEWYMILDADEVYTPDSFANMHKSVQNQAKSFNEYGAMYGITRRIEIANDLENAYGQDRYVPHHRIYHRTAIWTGPHPGEVPLYPQKIQVEREYKDVTCYHFHNAERSTKDKEVPKRMDRRGRGTYRPGEATSFDLFDKLPILKQRIEDFPVNPVLKQMQDGQM